MMLQESENKEDDSAMETNIPHYNYNKSSVH